jgi:hypothetical protein
LLLFFVPRRAETPSQQKCIAEVPRTEKNTASESFTCHAPTRQIDPAHHANAQKPVADLVILNFPTLTWRLCSEACIRKLDPFLAANDTGK